MPRITPRSHLVSRIPIALALLGLAACGGPTEAQRIRMNGVHVAAPAEPVDAGPPPGEELGFLPRRHEAGDTYRRTDETSVESGGRTTIVRVERTVTVDEVDAEGLVAIRETITRYERSVDGRIASPTREERELGAATIHYRLTDRGEPVGELEIRGAGRYNEALLRALGEQSLVADTLDRRAPLRVGAHREADTVITEQLAADVRPALRVHLDYTLAAQTEREARLEIDGTAELPEMQLGRNKLRGTGNLSGRWTIDPRDGFAGTRNVELRLYATRRDAQNRPVGESTTFLVRWQTNIARR
jgi:hypothetical protein